jgi:histone-lysine N-methyltransferase ASH1L
MALFAGDRPIMTGEELTYDYNFDPFSAKNVQKCLCGSPNCRGVLGPKPKEVKPAKQQQQPQQPAKDAEKKSVKGAKSSVKPGKRKLKDPFAFDSEDDDEAEASTRAIKKRKIDKASTSLKKALLVTKSVKRAKKAAKGAISKIKRTVSTVSMGGKTKTALTITKGAKVKAKVALTTSKGMKGKVKAKASTKVIKRATTTSTTSATLSGKSTSDTKAGAVKTVGRKPIPKLSTGSPSRSPSLTIVAAGIGSAGTAEKTGGHPSTPNKTGPISAELETTTKTAVTKSARKSTPSWKARENVAVINEERKKKEGKGKESEKNEKREKDKENVSAATSAASTPKPAKTTTKIRVITTMAGKRGLGVADR